MVRWRASHPHRTASRPNTPATLPSTRNSPTSVYLPTTTTLPPNPTPNTTNSSPPHQIPPRHTLKTPIRPPELCVPPRLSALRTASIISSAPPDFSVSISDISTRATTPNLDDASQKCSPELPSAPTFDSSPIPGRRAKKELNAARVQRSATQRADSPAKDKEATPGKRRRFLSSATGQADALAAVEPAHDQGLARMAFAEQQRWITVQQKTFTKWVNTKLEARTLEVEDLVADLSDGVMLIHLLECLSNEPLGRYASKPKLRVQRFENNLVVRQVEDMLEEFEERLVPASPRGNFCAIVRDLCGTPA